MLLESSNQAHEFNPFEDAIVSQEWIASVENEEGAFREIHIYPRLQQWRTQANPKVIVEVGCGQGICSDYLGDKLTQYIGIDPSPYLIERAKHQYAGHNKSFKVGNAYNLMLDDKSVDGIVLVNVLFHLKDLTLANREISRVLKPGGQAFVITANPSYYDRWEQYFFDYIKEGDCLTGKFKLPNNQLSKQTMYLHPLEKIKSTLVESGMQKPFVEQFGKIDEENGFPHFVSLQSTKL